MGVGNYPQTVGCTLVSVTINLQAFLLKDDVEYIPLYFWEQPVRRLRIVPLFQSPERHNRPGHALAVTDAALAANLHLMDPDRSIPNLT
jgi:hypothetical protein